MFVTLRNTTGDEHDGRWTWWEMTFKKKGGKKGSSTRRSSVESFWLWRRGMDALICADYCHSWGNLWVWGEPVGILSFLWQSLDRMGSQLVTCLGNFGHHKQENNWSRYSCARDSASMDASTLAHPHTHPNSSCSKYPFSQSPTRQLHTRAHPHTDIRTAVEPGQIAVAEDTCWNHQSQEPPSGQIKFVLVWTERNASRAKTGPH